MQLVEGQSLRDLAKGKEIGVNRIIELAIQICDGLGAAHDKKVIHRDIKPSNIVIDAYGRPKILDFGLAAIQGGEQLTKTGSTLGTVQYMSPEQVEGQEVDHRSDLFSLGVVLYELIAVRTPFEKENEAATLKAITQDNPEPLARYKSDIPVKLQEIVVKLLEKDKELRYQSAEGMIADLKRLMYDSEQTGFTRTAKKPKKRGTVVGITAALVVVVAAVLYTQFGPASDRFRSEDKVPVIAVLPFENLGSPEDQYFADGMTDEISSRLVLIDGLGVISRMSSAKLRESEKTLQEIGRDYGVDFVLEGRVRWSKVGEKTKIRITPQLTRVTDDRQMWSKSYDQTLVEIFSVQADIAAEIVSQLGLTLLDSDRQTLTNRPTKNPEAYKLYLQGLQKVRRMSVVSDYEAAQAALDSAVILDPAFALAHALRSESYTNVAGGLPESKFGRTALEAAERALELQPDLPQAHLAMGRYHSSVTLDRELALEHLSIAKSELYNDPALLTAIASVQTDQNRLQEALENLSKAVDLDPLNDSRHSTLAKLLQSLRRFSEAEQSINRALALNPEVQWYYEYKIDGLIAQYGEIERIKPVITEALKYCDTSLFIYKHSALTRYIPELKTDSVLRSFFQRQVVDTYDAERFPELKWFSIGHLDMFENIPDEARRRTDVYDGMHPGWDGILFSFAGDCKQAVEAGLREKELVKTTDCSP
jgi:TolB-like protein